MGAPDLQTAEIARLSVSKSEILAAYIFGSVAAGRARADSDIDVAVLLDPEFMKQLPLKYRQDLIIDAGAALETFDVDVVLLNETPPALAHNVITKGKLVYERSGSGKLRNLAQRTEDVFIGDALATDSAERNLQTAIQALPRRGVRPRRDHTHVSHASPCCQRNAKLEPYIRRALGL
jgi:predicted nucleotidyltransferase